MDEKLSSTAVIKIDTAAAQRCARRTGSADPTIYALPQHGPVPVRRRETDA